MSDPTAPRCPHCCGAELVRGLQLNQTAEVGKIGFPYKAAWILQGTEPLLADLCAACGTVVRLYVARTDRPWVRRKS